MWRGELGWQLSGDRPGFSLLLVKGLCLVVVVVVVVVFSYLCVCTRRGLIAQECAISQLSSCQCFLECVQVQCCMPWGYGEAED